ncbi:hypothetical protein BpHYR1_013441 [Brachionus plicatilis]|uniref:Uncharacterized protein n=1 Tax=Brachionus plicatilis TaxID=10195 RepID=A0A3M7SFG5_BRAPC|nr:hypothetical protein BpHYR1_013441 [Brachionus plicatilis]
MILLRSCEVRLNSKNLNSFSTVRNNLVIKLSLQKTLRNSAFCKPSKSILINFADFLQTYIFGLSKVAVEVHDQIKLYEILSESELG